MQRDIQTTTSMVEKLASIKSMVAEVVRQALQAGCDAAEVRASLEQGFSVTARQGDIETIEHHQEHSLSLIVYQQQRSATVSTSDLCESSMATLVNKACAIVQFTNPDPFAGLADRQRLAYQYPDLDLYHHWAIEPQQAIRMAVECEQTALASDQRLIHSEGASVSTYDIALVYANSHDFVGGYLKTMHSVDCSLVAEQDGNKENGYDYTCARDASKLLAIEPLAHKAADRTVSRLGARRIATQKCPIIFEAPVAKSFWRHLLAAISGSNLYRRSSFLLDHLGKRIFPEIVDIYQDPHVRDGLGSAPFDHEGVVTTKQYYVQAGELLSYVLSSYSARKLAMQTTGNAGGVFNLYIKPSDKDLQALLKEMQRGLLVTELIGQGVNLVTGSYSRGAAGFWVENGEIQYPVHEVTIAGNLKDMFAGVVAVGNDIDPRGNIKTGSVLLQEMTIAGDSS